MSINITQFNHTDSSVIAENPYIYDALIQLQNKGLMPESRAVLTKATAQQGTSHGVRTSLWISLEDDQLLIPGFCKFKGLWLIEHHNKKIFLMGSKNSRSSKSIGGQVIHDLDVLDVNAPWIESVTTALISIFSENIAKSVVNGLGKPYREFRYKGMIKSYSQLIRFLLYSALEAFIKELDQNIVQLMQLEGTGNNAIYNHYACIHYEQQRNRTQAANSYPFFVQLLRYDYKLRRAIDCGSTLSNELMTRYQVKPRTIKLLQYFVAPIPATYSKITIIKAVDRYTVEYFPKSYADQVVFINLSEPLSLLAEMLQVNVLSLAKPFKNGWKSGIEKLEKQFQKTLNIESIFEMMQASFFYGIRPVLNKNFVSPPDGWYKKWFSMYSLRRLMSMANRWEELSGTFSLNRINRINNGQDEVLQWPALIPTNHCHGSYRVIELTSQYDLIMEGRKLDHCVGSYASKCLNAGSFIYSMRDRFNKSLSTFEIKFRNNRVELVQHYAMCDSSPTKEQQDCVTHFINQVLSFVSNKQIAVVQEQRRMLWGNMQGQLSSPDTREQALSPTEIKELQDLVTFTHPAGTTRGKMLDSCKGIVEVENTADECTMPF